MVDSIWDLPYASWAMLQNPELTGVKTKETVLHLPAKIQVSWRGSFVAEAIGPRVGRIPSSGASASLYPFNVTHCVRSFGAALGVFSPEQIQQLERQLHNTLDTIFPTKSLSYKPKATFPDCIPVNPNQHTPMYTKVKPNRID